MARRPYPMFLRELVIVSSTIFAVMAVWEIALKNLVHEALSSREIALSTGEFLLDIFTVILAVAIATLMILLSRGRSEKVEADLRLSEERLARAQQIAGLGHWEFDVDRSSLLWSDEIYRIFGEQPGAIEPNLDSFRELVHPNDLELNLRQFQSALTDGVPMAADYRIILPDGSIRTMRDRGEAVRNPDGKIIQLIGTTQDITERKKAEGELHVNETRLKQALRIARLGNWEFDVSTETTWWSDETFELFNVPMEEGAPGVEAFGQLMPEEDRQTMIDAVLKAVTEGVPFSIEHGVLGRGESDRIFLSEGTAIRDASGTIVRLAGTNMDITERKHAEQDLQKAHDELERRVEERTHELSATMETMVEGVITIDERGKIETFSSSAEILFGYKAREVIGQNVSILMPEPDGTKHQSFIDRYLKSGEAHIIGRGRDVEAQHKDRTVFPIHISIGEMVLESGRKFVGTVQDITERRRTENALIESEARLKNLTDQSPVGIFRSNADGHVIQINDRCKEIFETWDEEILMGNDWTGFVHSKDKERVVQEIAVGLANGEAMKVEYQIAGTDEAPKWVIAQAQPEKNSNGELTGYVGSITDISAQKEAEQALSQSEERFRAITENSTDYVVIVDELGNRTYISPSMEASSTLPKEELIGKPALEFVDEAGRRALSSAIERAKNNPGLSEYVPEIKLTMPGSPASFREVLVTSMMHEPGVRGIVLSSRDITERKLMEKEAEESRIRMGQLRKRLDDAVESFTDGFVLFDADDRIVMCNSAYRKECQPIAKYLVPGTHFDDFARAMFTSTEIIGEEFRTEEKIAERTEIHKNPNLGPWIAPLADDRWILINEYKTHDGGTALIRTDITDRVKSEQEIVSAQQQAEAANKAKSEFLSSMSHELRTPMNAILGFAQLLDQDRSDPLSDSHRSFVDEILRSGHHMLELINGVLDLAKIESGGITFDLAPCEPRPLIDNCLKMVEATADEEGINLRSHFPDQKLPIVKIDNLRFKQAILNLLSNAIKYNNRGGEVVLECQNGQGKSLLISVSDNGNGIPVDQQQMVFEPFNRLGAESSDIPGTGIGLTVTKQLIEGMDGQVGFESTVGQGTTFWIELPIVKTRTKRKAY